MVQTAIRNRWLTDELKPLAVDAIRRGLTCGDERAEQTAVKNLLLMEAQNQKDEHAKVDEFHSRVIELARRCGIDVAVLGIGEATESGAGDSDEDVAVTTQD